MCEFFRLKLSALIFCALAIGTGGVKTVVDLDESNWTQMLTSEWMVEFYAPWCPACKGLQPTWKEFATWSDDLGITVAKVDVTSSPGLSGRFMVTALPTIFHVLNGEFRQYKGSRDKESFISFIEDKKWKQVEPVPRWQSPDSIQMTIISAFFKLSQMLRQFHNMLMEEYGLPSWGSYLIFAMATIVLGAVLGLFLVCVIDFIYPQKYPAGLNEKKKEKDSDDELADDDIKDDIVDDASQSSQDEPKDKSDSEAMDNVDGDEGRDGGDEGATGAGGDKTAVKKRKSRKE